MTAKTTSAPLVGEPVADQDDLGDRQAEILRRLGVEHLPPHETRRLPLADLLVPGEATVRVPRSLVASIKLVGVMQAPAVVRRCFPPGERGPVRYEVIAGRRRVLAARQAGLADLCCEVYRVSTPPLSALLALVENAQRSPAWIKEVADLRLLIQAKVGLTIPDLQACGFSRQRLAERLSMAQLPEALLDHLVAGQVPLAVARQLVRLTHLQQERLAALVQAGEPLTAELVQQTLRAHLDAGLAPMQARLAQAWEPAIPAAEPGTASPADQAFHELVTALHRFTQSETYQTVPLTVRHLTAALLQQVQRCVRQPPTQKE